MHVVATAGHVDHGKSTLVKALTGMEPDRLGEERRRGLTIDLGFVWTDVAGQTFAFVDVPGHQRFVPTMLAGTGPVTAVLFVVAADEGWRAQSSEHLAALDAFGVRHGVLAVTKADRADPRPVLVEASERLAASSLGRVPAVAVSAHTGAGIDALRAELATLGRELPAADTEADVRLWVDRAFTVHGAGTVVTGTLGAGRLRVGDELVFGRDGRRCGVRGLQSLGRACDTVEAVARVAVNLRGLDHRDIDRGDALLTPDAWRYTREIDVRLRGDKAEDVNRELTVHLGAAAVPCRVRPLATDLARLSLSAELPLRAGDRGLLRDPGQHRVPAGIEVLDPRPPGLRRRGAARARAEELAHDDPAAGYVRRHGVVAVAELRALGWEVPGSRVGRWAVADGLLDRLVGRVREVLPATGLVVRDGVVVDPRRPSALPDSVERAVRVVQQRLEQDPFTAPEAHDLAELGLGPKQLAAAERAGRLVLIADGVVLGSDALETGVRVLATLPEPFTVSQVRRALGTTRRVAVPLLERLDAEGRTRRAPDGTRTLRRPDR